MLLMFSLSRIRRAGLLQNPRMEMLSCAHGLLYSVSMKRFVVTGMMALFIAGRAGAQTSIDVLESDLKEVKQQHDTAASQLMNTFLATLQEASQSGGTALDLYKKAGGNLPDAAPVTKHYEYETPSEKAAREALDTQNFASVAVVIEVHCGLMRNAALLTIEPKAPGVQDRWQEWLKTTAEIYPQLAGHRALKDVAMRDSVVSSYLGFRGWGDAEPGRWSVRDLPELYRNQVLEPLRHPPGPGTMDSWDTYIAMRQADEPDKEKWTQQEEPDLDFDRDADDYAIQPSMDKLAALDALIKANPSDDHIDSWIKRMQAMIDSYRRGGTATGLLPGATPSSPSSEVSSVAPAATPGTTSSGGVASTPSATPGSTSSGGAALTPGATPGTTSSGTGAPLPAATPGTPSSGSGAPIPGATPGTATH
jgi:hypothetical protein